MLPPETSPATPLTVATLRDRPIAAIAMPPQPFINGEIHEWYRIMLGYSDQIVAQLLTRLVVKPGERVLDPFCGTGTTLVECMKQGIESVGIDANPSSVFAARVKTNWNLTSNGLLACLDKIDDEIPAYMHPRETYDDDPTYSYMKSSGMIKRGWISPEPLRKALAIKACIRDIFSSRSIYRSPLMLALISEVVRNASNVKFGPELYCRRPKADVDVLSGFIARVRSMAADLARIPRRKHPNIRLFEGDSRHLSKLLRARHTGRFDVIISSPPYPAEHDYTRNARLELAFLEQVTDLKSLRRYKKQMIRSHTKNIYVTDCEAKHVADNKQVEAVAAEIERKTKGQTSGFARYYPTVIREYFGGMTRHLRSALTVLKPGARCAYVVGEQASYVSVHVPTASILSGIATGMGYDAKVEEWRVRRSTTTAMEIREQILFLQKPQQRA